MASGMLIEALCIESQKAKLCDFAREEALWWLSAAEFLGHHSYMIMYIFGNRQSTEPPWHMWALQQ